jgi:hypothetical protein
MTRYGKILVFLNLALSFFFVAWTLGLYSERPPWKGVEGERGRVDELAAVIKGLADARATADARWAKATSEVIRLELDLPRRRAVNAALLNSLNTGAGAAAVPQLDIVNELVSLKRSDKPVLIDGKPAKSLLGYKNDIDKQLDEIRDTKDKINKVVADTTELTDRLNGIKAAAEQVTAIDRGLRGELAAAEQLTRDARAEQDFLQSPLTNYTVELEQLKRRQVALESRLRELTAAVRN